MKNIIIKRSIAAIVIMICGCAYNKSDIMDFKDRAVLLERPPVSYDSNDRYFNFSMTQIMKKKGDLVSAIDFMKKTIELDNTSLYLRKELAILYLQSRQITNALNLLETILSQKPDHVESLILFAKIKQDMGELKDAKKAYEKVLALDPEQKNIYLILGDLYLRDKDYENALKIYEKLIDYFPDSYPGHFFVGKIYYLKGDLDKAKTSFEKTLEIEPDLIEPQFEIINIYKKKGKEKKTASVYKNILAKNPENVRAAIGLGYYYHKNGLKKEAEKIFRQLGKRSETDDAVFNALSQYYINSKRFDITKVITEEILKVSPDNSDIHYLAGVAYDKTDEKKQALKHFEKVLPDSKFYHTSAINIAFIYLRQGNVEKAIDYMEEIVQKLPDNPMFLFYLGSFYEEAENFEKAEAVYNQGLEIDPDNPDINFRLGVVYDKINKKEKSIEKMKQVLIIEPENVEALNYLGYTYADLDMNLDEAEILIKKALKYKPDDGYIIDSLGWVYFKKGQYQKALPLLIKAASINPDDPLILEHLGDAYMMTSDKSKALDTYRKSLLKKKEDRSELEKKILELTKEKSIK